MGIYNQKTDHCKLVSENEIDFYIIDRMDEVKAEMLRLLTVVDNICRENGLKYWIDGGTLIGAVRHKGFIPWDDDIDISLLKKDYAVLIDKLRYREYSDTIEEYLWFDESNRYDHCCNYLCSNKNIYGRMKGSFGIVPIKLDIRPVNSIFNSSESLELNSELREIANEWIFNKKVKGLSKISEKYQKMSKHDFFKFYNDEYGFYNDTDNYVFALPYYEFANDGHIGREMFDQVIECQYEHISTFIPKNYDKYLRLLYGNYMEFPPVDSRVPAQYEYLPSKAPIKTVINLIQNPPKSKLSRLIAYMRIFRINKFMQILSEKFNG